MKPSNGPRGVLAGISNARSLLAKVLKGRRWTVWSVCFAIANVLVAALLLVATVCYGGARLAAGAYSREAWFETSGFVLLIVLAVVVLYFAEGSEIAVTTVLDRDEGELILSEEAKSALADLRRYDKDFVSGRQFIVVVIVVLFAALCEQYADAAAPKWPIFSVFFISGVVKAYGFAFPILTALWLSQLFAKFVAQKRPATFVQSAFTRYVIIQPSLWLGRTVMVGLISHGLTGIALRRKADDPRAPSRVKLYEALAAFRDGFGFEQTVVDLVVNPLDGSLDVVVKASVRAYAPKGRLFLQKDVWDAPIEGDPAITVSRPATLGKMDYSDGGKFLAWDFLLTEPLRTGDEFEFEVKYHVGPGGVNISDAAEFYYEQHKYPMKRLIVSVRLTDTTAFIINPGWIEAKISDSVETNAREASRFSITSQDGGVDFDIGCPLMGGTYSCRWRLAKLSPLQ
jgi:hypothetical protein